MANTSLTPNTGNLAVDRGLSRLTPLATSLAAIGLAGSLALFGSVSLIPTAGALTLTGVAPMTDTAIQPGSTYIGGPYVDPAPPGTFLTTTYVTPTGATIPVAGGGDLQAAINAANPGDVIVLTAGATFTGNFTLPSKSGSTYIYIISSALASLPQGTRVSLGNAASMPKIVSPNVSPAIATAAGAHHYRFAGIEITTTHAVTTSTQFGLVVLEKPGGNLVLGDCPTDIVFDRCYLHGTPTGNCRRGILTNSIRTSVVDCYLSDFHEIGADSQAVCAWNGPGPFKIVNNYLEAAGENIMYGGADSVSSAFIPSDIEVRNNYCFKPVTWNVNDPVNYAGLRWTVKNLFELKSAQRVLVNGNTFDRKWGNDGSQYHAIVFTVRNQDGTAPWSNVLDVEFTNNLVLHVGGGINFLSTDNNFASGTMARVLVRNNVFDINGPAWQDIGDFCFIAGGIDISIDHNSLFHSDGSLGNNNAPIIFTTVSGTTPILSRDITVRLTFINNICNYGNFGFFGDMGAGTDNAAFAAYAPDIVFRRNAIVGGTGTNLPVDNFYPATFGDVGFLNLANFPDVRLAPTSPFHNAGLDLKDIGVDYEVANQGLALVGVPPIIRVTQLRTPGTGALTGTGVAPTIIAGSQPTNRTPSTGALTLTGGSPNAPPSTPITPPTGALTLTLGTVRTPATGALVTAGGIPTLGTVATRTPTTGTLTLVGQTVQRVSSGGAIITPSTGTAFFGIFVGITPPTGAISLGGVTPGRLVNVIRPIGQASLVLAEGNSTIKGNILTPATGSLVVTGIAGGTAKTLAPATAVVALAGAAPTVGVDRSTAPGTGALVLTGTSSPIPGNILTITTGALTLTGGTPTVTKSFTPPTGSLALTGGFAGIPGVTQFAPPTGALVLAGVAPTTSTEGNLAVAPPTGALTAAGVAGRLNYQIFIDPRTNALSLTGAAPTTSTPSTVTAPTGALVLTGNLPVPQPSASMRPPTGSLVLGGVAVVASRDTLSTPTAGTLTVAGQSALLPGPLITPDTGALVALGLDPVSMAVDSGVQIIETVTGELVFLGRTAGGDDGLPIVVFDVPERTLVFDVGGPR